MYIKVPPRGHAHALLPAGGAGYPGTQAWRSACERAAMHGGHTPSLIDLFNVFTGLEDELAEHMTREEEILFPAVVAMSRGEAAGGSLSGAIACMMHEHEEAGAAVARLRELSRGFEPPGDACNTYRALSAGLRDLEEDLHCHIHFENSVLFPAAEAMQSRRD